MGRSRANTNPELDSGKEFPDELTNRLALGATLRGRLNRPDDRSHFLFAAGTGVGDGVGTGVGDGVGTGVGDGVGIGVGTGVGDGVGTGVGDGVGCTVG